MKKEPKLISLIDLAEGLGMDRSNLKKLAIRLGIEHKTVRGNRNQWTQAFSNKDVEMILEYRRGISHNLVLKNGVYAVRS